MWGKILNELTNFVLMLRGWQIISTPIKVDIFQPDGTPEEDLLAEVNTAIDYSIIDEKLARTNKLMEGDAIIDSVTVPGLGVKKYPVIMVDFSLAGKQKRSRWVVTSREKEVAPVVIGSQDLSGLLVRAFN